MDICAPVDLCGMKKGCTYRWSTDLKLPLKSHQVTRKLRLHYLSTLCSMKVLSSEPVVIHCMLPQAQNRVVVLHSFCYNNRKLQISNWSASAASAKFGQGVPNIHHCLSSRLHCTETQAQIGRFVPWAIPSYHMEHDMEHKISIRCVAHDLHTIAPWPLELMCWTWRQFAVQWEDCKGSQIAPFNAIIIITIIISIIVVNRSNIED